MPRKDQSAHKQQTNNANKHAQQYFEERRRQSPLDYECQEERQDQSYQQSTPPRNYPQHKTQNTDSRRQQTNRPPKYQNSNPSSEQNTNRQPHQISRIREQNIEIKGSNQSKHKEKVSHSRQQHQNEKQSKQVGKLFAHVHHSRQEVEEQVSANTPEERKIRDLHANMEKLSESLLDLRENYEHLEKQEIKYSNLKSSSQIYDKHKKIDNTNNHYPPQKLNQSPQEKASRNSEEVVSKSKAAPKSNQEILKFLLEKQREKEERKKKIAIVSEQNRKKLQEDLLQRNKQEEQFIKWRKNQIRAAHNYEQKHKREKEIEESRKKAAEQYSKQIKDKKYSYLLKKQQLQEKAQKQFEQKREKAVSERKEIYNKPLDYQEIEEHQKWFYAKRQELLEQKRMVRQDVIQKIEQGNSNLPEFWKGNAHSIAQEERNKIKVKLKQPHQKAQKIKEYKEYIQEKFKPKSPKQNQSNSLNIYDPSKFREVKRYRYYKGVSYGEIAQTAPVPKDAKEIMRIGNSNMEIMKKIPKKKNNNSSLQIYSFTPQPYRKFDLNLVRNIFSSVVEKQKAKPIKISLPENIKCQQLDAVVDKIRSQSVMLYDKEKYLNRQGNKNGRNQQEQREVVDGLVSNIELKLNLLAQL